MSTSRKLGPPSTAWGRQSWLSACLVAAILLSAGVVRSQSYHNPVVPGDFPDPSVIRVGADFYATATTGNWAPHFQLLHSRDLVNWEAVGSVLTTTPTWAKGDFWAPEIIADKGRYFVYYTARRDDGKGKKGTLCVAVATAARPDGPYTDKGPIVCQEMGSLDPFFMRDEGGKPFLIWKEDGNDRGRPTWLYAQQLDESGTKLLGSPKKLFRNTAAWENHVVEGAYVLRRDGWFYLFYSGNACCGRSCKYALGVARSRTLLGEWEKNPANPILAANSSWQCPGHGSIVGADDGREFLLYHAYRNAAEAFNIGREALLDEVKFRDGWPAINGGRGPSENESTPFRNGIQHRSPNLVDEFSEAAVSPIWSYPIHTDEKIVLGGGFLNLAPNPAAAGEAVVGQRTVSGDYTASVRVVLANASTPEKAGLSVYSWRGAAVGVSIGGGRVFSWRRDDGRQQELASIDLAQKPESVVLRVKVADGETFRFAFSTDGGGSWRDVGEKISKSDIEGARLALIYDGAAGPYAAKFDWLRVTPD